MKQFYRILKSEIYKFFHSALFFIHLLVPILGIVVFLVYYMISPWDDLQKVSTYLQVLAMVFPLLIAVIIVIESEMEAHAGFYQTLQIVPCKKYIVHIAKLVVLLTMGFLSVILAIMGFGITFRYMGNDIFSIFFYVKAAILLFCGYIPLYELQYLISFSLSKGAGIGCGIVGSLLSALLMTGLGDAVWHWLPWSVSARMCSVLAEFETKGLDFTEWSGAKEGLMFMVVAGILLFVILLFWGARWETPKCEAE